MLGLAVNPVGVPTMRSMWQPGDGRPLAARFIGTPPAAAAAIGVLLVLLAAGMLLGIDRWS